VQLEIQFEALLWDKNFCDTATSRKMTARLKYRPEIDGLRAVAVLAVIFFHAGFRPFQGGFVGVDIFFVISGFLITSLILEERERNEFSFAGFYERRARRILPALFAVSAVSTIFALWLMVPRQLAAFSKALIYVPLFGSNFLFWQEAGYFAPATGEMPLIHTWSLGVEEQFYIAFPILLLLALRFAKARLSGVIFAAALCSFLFSEFAWRHYPEANFYLIPSRAWELLLGAGLSVLSRNTSLADKISRRNCEILSALGLAAILGSVLLLKRTSPSPSIYVLPAEIGTALIIAFGQAETGTAKLLRTKWLVSLGLISYSAYLWHQPIFAFFRIVTLDAMPRLAYLPLIVLTIAVAAASWKFIEIPFRRRDFLTRKSILLLAVAVSFVSVAGGAAILYSQGTQPPDPFRINYGLSEECEGLRHGAPAAACMTSPSPKLVVWGDSFAMHIVPGILAANPQAQLAQMTLSRCGPFIDASLVEDSFSWARECKEFNASVLAYISSQPSIEIAVLSSPFNTYISRKLKFSTQRGVENGSMDFAVSEMKKTVAELRRIGKKVVIVAPPPRGPDNTSECLERIRSGKFTIPAKSSCDFDSKIYRKQKSTVLEFLRRVQTEADISVIGFDDFLCTQMTCKAEIGGVPVFRDGAHFSIDGSRYVGVRIDLYRKIVEQAR
jgi:peptidoglycan/LPS O-acetylase OafA/YrhL